MSRYGRGIRKGKRVRQGQVIGYVGTTGRSTGNHLHYEILRNGRQLNPMNIKMPSGRKLIDNELSRYRASVKSRYKIHFLVRDEPLRSRRLMSTIQLHFEETGVEPLGAVILHGLFGMGRNWAGSPRR